MATSPSRCRYPIGLFWLVFLSTLSAVQATVPVFVGQPVHAGNEYLIAGWNFNQNDDPPESQFQANHGSGFVETDWETTTFSDFVGTTINAFASDLAGRDLGLRNGAGLLNEGRHLTFRISMDGFEKLILSYATRRSASGFTDQHWFWSIDGENFVFHATVKPSGNYALETISFESVADLAGAPEVYFRVVLDGIPEQPSATGNNRLDNVQIRAFASEGTAGPGFAIFQNLTAGSPYHRSELFVPGEELDVELELSAMPGDEIARVLLELPIGWKSLSVGNLELLGEGFSEATLTLNGDQIEISGAKIKENRSGRIRIIGIKSPPLEKIRELGFPRFTIRTASAGDEPALLNPLPGAIPVLPVGEIADRFLFGQPIDAFQRVALSGVATISSGLLSATELWSFFQDERAGIAIYAESLFDFWSPVVEGNRYVVVGEIEKYRDGFRLRISDVADLFDLGIASELEAEIRTTAQLLADPERMSGRLVRIRHLFLAADSNPWPEPGESGTISVTDDGGESVLDIFVNRFTDMGYQAAPDFPADFVGIFSRFAPSGSESWDYLLIPRSREDLLPPSEVLVGYAAWVEKYFTEEERLFSDAADPEKDPDGDGVVNLLEYAFGGNPHRSGREILPEISNNDGRMEIVFRRSRSADDLLYAVEASEDLLLWREIWSSEDFLYESELDYLEERVSDDRLVDDSSGFLRLRVILKDLEAP